MDYYQKYMKYKNKYLHAKHTLGYDMSGGADPSKCYIFFQDVADADNFMSVVAFIQLFGRPTLDYPIHFVLTQRPENLGVPKAYKGGPINEELFTLDNDIHGPDDKTDALLVAQDGVRRFITFMHKNYNIGKTLAEAYNLIRVYDGGLPSMSSNMSHLAHKRDYLFDRADLLTPPREIGDLITAEEYAQLEVLYNDLPFDTPDPAGKPKNYVYDENKKTAIARQTILRGVIKLALDTFGKEIGRDNTHILRPLSELPRWINTKNTELSRMKTTIRVIAFLLAPLTGFANLFEIDDGIVLKKHLTHVYGQLFAWDVAARAKQDAAGVDELNALGKPLMDPNTYTINPNGVNIFRNQFNIDCDTESFEKVKTELQHCENLTKILWVPTEMLKGGKNNQFYSSLYNAEKGLLDHDVLNKIAVSALLKDDIEENKFLKKLVETPLMKLWSQWSGIKSGGQPIFDPSVIFVAHDDITSNTSTSTSMINETKPIEYITHDQNLYMRKFPNEESGPKYNRPVYQIKETQSLTKHSAVRELNVNEHFIRLIKLLLYTKLTQTV
jgi:hypothetical protein